ncbi:MAG: SGNH/GDSL hydrolase family protein [Bacteroidales bacterium]
MFKRFIFSVLAGVIGLGAFGQVALGDQPLRILALGDSYTIGEGVDESERFPNQLGELLMLKGYRIESIDILAKTGWRTDELIEAIGSANPARDYDLVTLLIGVNNQYQKKKFKTFLREFRHLTDLAISLAGGRPDRVLVISIPDYSYTPFGQKLDRPAKTSNEIHHYNRNNRIIAGQLGVRYVEITKISKATLKDPSLLTTDGLHPSGKLYGQWAREIIRQLSL